MTLGSKISEIRKKKGVKAADLAEKIGRSGAVMSDIENDRLKGGPSPEILIRIANALDAPEILLYHCQACPIRQHVVLRYFPELNNIRRDPAVIAARLRKEMVEAAEALDRLGERFSAPDFKNRPDYQEIFEREMEQVIDVKRGIEILEFELVLEGVHTPKDLKSVYERQQAKCEARGHHKPKGSK
jgi:transcriptional regulator with XRE-family HTH domain